MKTTRILLGFGGLSLLLVVGSAILAEDAGSQATGNGDQATVALDAATLQAIKTMPWSEAAELLAPLRAQAEQALADGRHADAASGFQKIAELLPTSPNGADAWLSAGNAYGQASNVAAAKMAYDNAVSVCKRLLVVDHANPPDYQQGRPFPDALKATMRRALRYKAELCKNAGETQEAWQAIRLFRAEEPEYFYLREILPLQAELRGVAKESLSLPEHEAWRLSDEAKWARRRGENDTALRLADETIARYPETGGAVLARRLKAAVLWRLKRYDEARAIYRGIVDELEPVSRTCNSVREARAKTAYLDGASQSRAIIAKCQSGARDAVTEADWEAVLANSRIIMSDEAVPVEEATGHIMCLEMLHFRGEHEKVLAEAERLKALHNRPENLSKPEYKNLILGADCYAAYGLLKLNRPQEAVDRFRTVVSLYGEDQSKWRKGTCLPAAYFGLWSALRATGVPAEEARTEVAPLLSAYPPGSYYVRTIEHASSHASTSSAPAN